MLDILTKTYLHLIVIMYGFSNFLEASRDFESSYKVEGKERSFSIKIKRILFDRERHIEGERDKVFCVLHEIFFFLFIFFKYTKNNFYLIHFRNEFMIYVQVHF